MAVIASSDVRYRQQVLDRESGPVLTLTLRGTLQHSDTLGSPRTAAEDRDKSTTPPGWFSTAIIGTRWYHVHSCVSDGSKVGNISRTRMSPMLTTWL